MEITLQLSFVCARHCDVFLLRHNYVIYLFVAVTFFDDVKITLYFSTFELRMDITLQLRFVFARYCDVFFITSQHVIYLSVAVTFDDVRITLYFGTFELRTEITIQNGHFLVTFVCNQNMTKKYVIIM